MRQLPLFLCDLQLRAEQQLLNLQNERGHHAAKHLRLRYRLLHGQPERELQLLPQHLRDLLERPEYCMPDLQNERGASC
jgi:hypothetical protein